MKATSALLCALLTIALPGLLPAGEIFPVDNTELLRIRVLDGRSGKIVPHAHIVLLGGYDQGEVHRQIFREERLTNERGEMRLSRQMGNLPWLQVWVDGSPLCQERPEKQSFSVELIRRDGVSAPNRCGTAVAEEEPGVFTVFVKNPEMGTKGGTAMVSYSEAPPAPVKPVYPFADYKAQGLAELHAAAVVPEAPVALESVAAVPVVPSTPLWFAVQSIPGFTMAPPKQSHKLQHHAPPAICQANPAPAAGAGKNGAPAKANTAPAKSAPGAALPAAQSGGKKAAAPKLERVSAESAAKAPAKRQPSAAELAKLKPSMRIRPRVAKSPAAADKSDAAQPKAAPDAPKDTATSKSAESAKAPVKPEAKAPAEIKPSPAPGKSADAAKKNPEPEKKPAKAEEKKAAENKPKPSPGKSTDAAKKSAEPEKKPAKAEEKKAAENKPKAAPGKSADAAKKSAETEKKPAKAEEKKAAENKPKAAPGKSAKAAKKIPEPEKKPAKAEEPKKS